MKHEHKQIDGNERYDDYLYDQAQTHNVRLETHRNMDGNTTMESVYIHGVEGVTKKTVKIATERDPRGYFKVTTITVAARDGDVEIKLYS